MRRPGAQVVERLQPRPFPRRTLRLQPRPARRRTGAQAGAACTLERFAKGGPVQPGAKGIGRLPAHPHRPRRFRHAPALFERAQEGLHLGHGPAIIGIALPRAPARAGGSGGRWGGRLSRFVGHPAG
ncbi:hypothetical protein [Qipengyuania huizhouensis]|uniref:hypothetical protein n=1 Tax=Qipengyuania huizhouensis TaxID=2867245 RepID=UPI001C882D1B|nr:hypothetical protein [Qipengyuania huizhouensis]MBX7459800.1 hypothetical protein [Qipengyuania huizhouensis]